MFDGMPLHPETCAHCSSTMALLHQSFEAKERPPEAMRGALLFGIAIGDEAKSAPTCEECRAQLEAIRTIFKGVASRPPVPDPEILNLGASSASSFGNPARNP